MAAPFEPRPHCWEASAPPLLPNVTLRNSTTQNPMLCVQCACVPYFYSGDRVEEDHRDLIQPVYNSTLIRM